MVTFRLDHQSISIDLPDATKKELDFTESSFFASPTRCLPSPAEVQAVSSEPLNDSKANPVRFEPLDLIVKFGPQVRTLEALNLWVVRRIFKDKVPVPEVFGWRIDDQEHWDTLNGEEKGAISDQLGGLVQSLRQLEQDPSDRFIVAPSPPNTRSEKTFRYMFTNVSHPGSIDKQNLQDYVSTTQPKMGLFSSVKDSNDQFALLHQLPFRDDLHRANIIVSPSAGDASSAGSVRLVIVDWQSAGWYPEYWEYCKALYTASYEDEWRRHGYIDRVCYSRGRMCTLFGQSIYCMAVGAV